MKSTQMNLQSVDIYKTSRKIRIEDDSTLPDYCSDIARVIKVEGVPTITSKKVYMRDDTLFCDLSGTVYFNVIYVSDNGGVESHNFSADFFDATKTDVANIDADTMFAFVCPVVENTVCKVQSPRRISVRTDLSLNICAKANVSFDCYSKGEDTRVETRERQSVALKTVSSKDAEFTVSEEIKLPKSCPPMERILSARLTLALEDARAGDNSVNFSGNAVISCIYIPEADGESRGEIQAFYQPVEVKGSLEIDDSRNDMVALVNLVPSRLEYEIAVDNLGENRVMKVDFSYTAECLVQENSGVTLTEDIYGIGCSVAPTYDKRELRKYMGALRESTAIKEKIPLKKGIEEVEGATAEVSVRDTYFENNELFADCRVTFSAIGITEDSATSVSESFDISVHLNLPSEIRGMSQDVTFEMSQSAGYVDARVEDSSVNIAFDITTVAHVYYNDNASFVSAIDVEEGLSHRETNIFYYPSESDTMWSIGKSYGVSQTALAEANGELKRVMKIPF